jgi:hypothetical protein
LMNAKTEAASKCISVKIASLCEKIGNHACWTNSCSCMQKQVLQVMFQLRFQTLLWIWSQLIYVFRTICSLSVFSTA